MPKGANGKKWKKMEGREENTRECGREGIEWKGIEEKGIERN